MIVFVHGHHRHIAVKIAVDSQANIRSNETASYNRKIAVRVRGAVLELVHCLRLGGGGLDVVVQVPAIVFVDEEERSHKFAVYILGSAIRTGHTLLGDDDGANQSGVGVVTLEVGGVIGPDDRTAVVVPWAGTLRHFPDVGLGPARGN